MYPYLNPQMMAEFERRFPDANMFLIRESLAGELAALLQDPKPNQWQRDRINTLRTLKENTERMGCKWGN